MICKQNAAHVHLTQIDGDKMKKVDVCEECAKHKGLNDSAGFAIADLLLGLGASQEIAGPAAGEEIKCPACGFTQADFKKAGRLGCAQCYTSFAEGLESLLKTMHKGTRHVGKAPHSFKQSRDLSDRLKNLQKKLDKAVEEEDFEQAAGLRDEIKSTKDQMNNLEPGLKS
ncbi:MAG: UvrB/UvrC motif-containing protein [Verrucomicrobiota bacterium]|jgi:protein arginine kinase activator